MSLLQRIEKAQQKAAAERAAAEARDGTAPTNGSAPADGNGSGPPHGAIDADGHRVTTIDVAADSAALAPLGDAASPGVLVQDGTAHASSMAAPTISSLAPSAPGDQVAERGLVPVPMGTTSTPARVSETGPAAISPTDPLVPPSVRRPTSGSNALRPTNAPAREELINTVRLRLQSQIVGAFKALLDAKPEDVRPAIEKLVNSVVDKGGYALTREERTRLVEEMLHDVTGFGPLEPLLADPTITEVMVNGPNHIYVERKGKIQRVESAFLNDQHVLRVIERIIAPLGRRIDESSPRVDARLPDGSRVNAIIEPLSLIGPVITVRKFSKTPYMVDDLVRFGTATPEMFDFLRACIEARLNLFVSGGTGSGKTTTLNVLSTFIPNDERIVTIEDAAELQLQQDHVITLEARPPNLEGEGEITIRNLLRNAMHMRPDRVIVGECRAGEALDMLQAMTTGHDGSLSTGHANTPKDMLRRLETMVLMTGYKMPLRAIREQISSAVDIIVHTARLKDGQRKIVNITEVYGTEEDQILTQDIFTFVQTGFRNGKIEGSLQPTGIRPTFMAQLKRAGIELGAVPVGDGRAVVAGGTVYVSSIGPVDPETGEALLGSVTQQTRQAMANLKERLEGTGSSLDQVVWANWSLYDPADFDEFNEEWNRWFPGDPPLGQLTLMPPLQRRAGFAVSLGVIATV
jgi:pilus assembly protein CpaF